MEKHLTKSKAEKMLNTMINHYGKGEWLKAETCYVKSSSITKVKIEANKIGYTILVKSKKSFDWIPYKTFTNYKSAKQTIFAQFNKMIIEIDNNEVLKAA